MDSGPDQGRQGAGVSMWYLKKTDGLEYGPEELESIRRWAAESRVVSGNSISRDRKEWTPVEQVPELEMDWLAELPDGRRYGPFNIAATKDLVGHKVLPEAAKLVHRQTGQALTVREYLDHGVPPAPASDEASAATDPKPSRPRRNRRKADDPQGSLWSAPREEIDRPAGEEPGAVGETAAAEDERAESVREEVDPASAGQGEADTALDEAQRPEPPAEPGMDAQSGAAAEAMETPAVADAAEEDADAIADSTVVECADDEVIALGARVSELEAALAAAEARSAAGERALARAKDKSGKVEGELRAALEVAGAERDAARMAEGAARSDAQAARAGLEAAQADLEEVRGASEAERRAREKTARDRARVEAEKDQRIAAAVAELQAARADEQAAKAALEQGATGGRKQVMAAETRVKDLLQERTALAELLEVESARNRKWKGAALVMAAVWLLTLLGLWFWRGRKPDAGAAPQAAAQVETSGRTAPSQATRPAAAPARGAAPAPAARKPSSMPTIRGASGVTVVFDRTGCRIVFDQGVFSSGTNISPWAAGVMRQLAPQILPNLDRFTLVVEGHTDRSPVRRDSRYGSNEELALSRARAFARYLTQTHGIATARMKTVAAVEGAPPHPETDDASRARNRTVVLKLVRHAGQ